MTICNFMTVFHPMAVVRMAIYGCRKLSSLDMNERPKLGGCKLRGERRVVGPLRIAVLWRLRRRTAVYSMQVSRLSTEREPNAEKLSATA